MERKFRVLLVDDSAFFRQALVGGLADEHDFEVVGTAADPYEARDKILSLTPDVMTLDIEMPRMNGVEFLKILLPQWPLPVLVVSSARSRADECRKAGAVDFVDKPMEFSKDSLADFVRRVKFGLYRAMKIAPPHETLHLSPGGYRFHGIVALGASTGGTQSTTRILKELPADFPGIVIVQHMPHEFTRMYAENIDHDCAMTIREAKNGDIVEPGLVLIAPGDEQMSVRRMANGGYTVKVSKEEKVNGHRPSVDVLFHSVAQCVGRDAIGIILTGMGADGAEGLLAMRHRGAFTIGQDEKTSVVYGMPKVAYERGAVVRQCPLEKIAPCLMRYVRDLQY